jgi:hypothetical protein
MQLRVLQIPDDIVQGDETFCDKHDYRNKMDQAILSALQVSWIAAELNRNISHGVNECGAVILFSACLQDPTGQCMKRHRYGQHGTGSVNGSGRGSCTRSEIVNG